MAQAISRRSFLVVTCAALAAVRIARSADGVPASLDHIILGCNDLGRGIAFVEQHTGTAAKFAGVHPGRGTRNALLALGGRSYLEILAPDPQQKVDSPYAELKGMYEPRLIGWAAHPASIHALAKHLHEVGVPFAGPSAGSRRRPDGKVLHWTTLTVRDDRHGLLPFFIEWSAGSVHPSVDTPAGCHLADFKVVAPDPEELAKIFRLLEVDVTVDRSERPQLIARIVGPKGQYEMKS